MSLVNPGVGNSSGSVTITSVFSGKTIVTTAGVRVQLSSNTSQAVTIKALSTNTGIIYIGNVSVSASNGHQLSAGDSESFDVSNTNIVYIDSSVNGEGVTFLGIN